MTSSRILVSRTEAKMQPHASAAKEEVVSVAPPVVAMEEHGGTVWDWAYGIHTGRVPSHDYNAVVSLGEATTVIAIC